MTKEQKLIELILEQNARIQERAHRHHAPRSHCKPLAAVTGLITLFASSVFFSTENEPIQTRTMDPVNHAPIMIQSPHQKSFDATPNCDGLIMTLDAIPFCSPQANALEQRRIEQHV